MRTPRRLMTSPDDALFEFSQSIFFLIYCALFEMSFNLCEQTSDHKQQRSYKLVFICMNILLNVV